MVRRLYIWPAFCAEVRRLREAQGLTLEELAERSGLPPKYIDAIERGERSVTAPAVVALAKGLDINPRELFVFLADVRT